MNKTERLKQILEKTNIKVKYRGGIELIKLPFLIFYEDKTILKFADNTVLEEEKEYNILLCSEKKDIKLEEEFEKILIKNNIFYQEKTEIYIQEENMIQITYNITI